MIPQSFWCRRLTPGRRTSKLQWSVWERILKRNGFSPVGPADPAVAKVNDIYKKVIYIKTKDYQTLVELKDRLEHYMRDNKAFKDTVVQFDFNPMSGF